ncbi:DUF1660 family phage protein [Lactococcus petauri]|uniref:DUF1660 family phage protein n=1 Tax=Lactococcus petauri TaxID=1940789 RepID=UPI003A4DE280
MKLLCKLFGHKWIYYDLHKRCKWCDKRIWFIRDIELIKGLKKNSRSIQSIRYIMQRIIFQPLRP